MQLSYKTLSGYLFLFILITLPLSLTAQTVDGNPKPNLFLDCNRCYQSYLKENITFVNYVRDKTDADIHLLITRAQTGSGGTEYTLSFIGQKDFGGMDNKIIYVSPDTDTQEETRAGLARRIKVGLIQYISQSSIASQIGINFEGGGDETSPNQRQDKWNYWIFEIGSDASFDGEEQEGSLELEGDVSARRITREWKIELRAEGSYERERFELDDEDTSFTQNSKRFNGLMVKSLSPHWSAGVSANLSSSTFRNTEFEVGGSPAVEFNIYPYREYNEHELSFLYEISPTYFQYRDTTIFNKTEEFLVEQSLEINYEVTQTWGSTEISLQGSNFLHDFSKNRIDFRGELNFRIFRGLSMSFYGNYSLINDQIALPGEGITDEEALLRLRDRATGYEYRIGIGLNYTFGSLYNNIVNPRF